jgi:hypothetical protein
MMATDVKTAGLVDLTMGNDVVPAVTIPGLCGPIGVLATDSGVPDLLLGKHCQDYSDDDITDNEERKKRNKKRRIKSTILDRGMC